MQLGRNGSTEWIYSANANSVTHVTTSRTTGKLGDGLLVVGAGLTPATFSAYGTQLGTLGLLLREQLSVWWRTPSDAEITTQIKAGQYPFGRGR